MFNKKNETNVLEKTETLPQVTPRVDILENDEGFILRAEMPGVKKEDISISVDTDSIEIKGVSSQKSEGELIRTEFSPAIFNRKFKLGRDIDRDNINASMEQGILRLDLPRSESAKPRQIDIN